MQDVTETESDAGSIDVADGDVADTKDVVETESEMVEAFVKKGDGEFQLRLMTGLEPDVRLLSGVEVLWLASSGDLSQFLSGEVDSVSESGDA